MRSFTKVFLALLLCTLGVLTTQAKTEKVHATFENPSNTNTTWNAETKTFTWSTTYYNQLRNIGLPSGDITKYKKLVIDCEIKSGNQFRVLIYKGGSNKTLYASNGVNEFVLADTLKALYPDDYNEFLLGCDEICLSGNNAVAPGEAVINDVYLETYDDEGEKVYATFENPSNTNTTWNAETKTFTWSTTYYNQLRNIGLPTGDITKYKKLVVDTEIKSGEQFRILFYKGGSNKTLYASNGVNEFILADTLKALYPDDYNEFLLACDEICLSGNNAVAPGEAIINSVYLETYPENESVEIPDIVYEEDPGKPEGEFVDFTEAFPSLNPKIGIGEDTHPIVLGNGDVVVGQRTKDVIADLSEYSKLTIVTSPNLKLVVYMNHEIDAKQNAGDYTDDEAGKYVFLDVQANENGIAEIDLTQYAKQDLNCICLPWDNNNKGTVWYLLLTKKPAPAATEVTFNFADPNFRENIGETMADSKGWIYNETFTVDGATLQITGGSAPSRIYVDANRGQNLVTYKEYTTLTFNAPEGKAITKIEFTGAGTTLASIKDFTASSGTINGMIWTGNAEGVRFAQGGTSYLANAILTLVDKTGETAALPAIEYTKCANIAEFNALAAGTYAEVTLTDAEVIGKSADGCSTVWVQDATGGCWIQYTSLNDKLNEKTKINGTVFTVKRATAGNTHMKEAEATLNSQIESAAIEAYTVVEGTIEEVNIPANLNKVVKITADKLVMTTASAQAATGTLYVGESTITVNNGIATANQALCKISGWAKDKVLENIIIEAILVAKSASENQLLPISITEVPKPIYIETDLTAQFPVNFDGWQGATGFVGWAAPEVTTNDGRKTPACEKYESTCANTGDVFTRTLSGLTNGIYRIELYGAAAYTSGRGFDSELTEGDETAVYLYAETAAGVVKQYIPAHVATDFNGTGIATAVLDNVEITDGTVKLGMFKDKAYTNWHVVQIKGVTAKVDAVELHANELAAAKAALNAEENAVVTGEEKTALETAIATYATVAEQTADAYKTAIKALSDATAAFTAAKAAYEGYIAAQAYLVDLDLPYADAAKKPAAEAATNAADATAKAEALMVALRAYYESHALAEGVVGAKDMTSAITNPNAEEAVGEPWNTVLGEGSEGSIGIRDNEPFTDGDNVSAHKYFDGGNWGANAWDVALEQEITLPAGKYLLTVTARAEKAVDFTLYAGEAQTKLIAISSVGGVFNRGWNDGSVEFEMAEEGNIKIGVHGVTNEIHNWMSFTRFRLVQLEEKAPVPAHTWDFTQWSEATVANLKADAAASMLEGWSDVEKKADAEPTEASKDNCFWAVIPEGGELKANGVVIEELKGLIFGASFAGNRSLAIAVNYPSTSLGEYNGPAYLWLGGKNFECFTIPAVKRGTVIKMGVESHKPADARGVQLLVAGTQLTDPEGAAVAAPTTYTEQTWAVPAGDSETVDVVVKNTNGCHIYFIDADIDESIATGISNLNNSRNMNGTIYNLNGQKMEKMNKGLYIVNGKKVFVK